MHTRISILLILLLGSLLAACADPTVTPPGQSTLMATAQDTRPVEETATQPSEALPTSAAVSTGPLTGKIVYDFEGDIYVMELPGSEPVRLTTDPAEDFDAEWSPDGTQVVFRSHRDGNEEIYVMNADGSAQTNLTNYAGADWSPAWSPDGTWIAFHSNRPEGSGIWVMNADGSGPRPVGTPPGVNDYPTWSPDSQRIAWNCTFGRFLDIPGQGDFEICVVNADGTRLVQLTDTAGNNKYPAWSPDGSKIAFVSDRNGWPTLPDYTPAGYEEDDFGDNEIFIMNADGSEQVNLTNHPREGDSFPAWAADGRIIFTRYGCLIAMNADGSGLTAISREPCSEADSGGFPDWYQPAEG
ncbi:MAG: hypothetical protein L0332_05295 [Chloroflexi bacterium]|nr:hypothetical protein [Chloroflexota bacterium]MCI0579943.1 hypothetical protein [Chloroflexota bacterium]MCI0646526.1 hypothetical protein [Chloroflexota bacterium]MCI0726122.1 hypothetical protein [Chloroflexota bacterium]